MSVKVNRSEVLPEEHPFATVWRQVRRDGPHHVGVGMTAFKARSADLDIEAASEAHDVPEVHYVLSGEGVLYEEGERMALRAGDAVITPPGRRHLMWSTTDEPLVTIYVAVGRDAFG
jgi:mannose-6-phosphate isomerase-like protein (cupin superfamily)